MVTNTLMPRLHGSKKVREQAGRILNELLADSEQLQSRLAEFGRVDPIKSVTGTSSLEKAITSTRELIQDMDRLAAEFECELDETVSG